MGNNDHFYTIVVEKTITRYCRKKISLTLAEFKISVEMFYLGTWSIFSIFVPNPRLWLLVSQWIFSEYDGGHIIGPIG